MPERVVLSEKELRTLQLNELELILEVYRVCRLNGIRFSLDGGTLLGAIRHKGFIPWDDDADVVFTREEYEKFFEACKRDLNTERYFLQDYRTDPEYRWGYAKMRLNGTEFVRLGQENMKYRTGVCIDIFVLDNVSDNPLVRKLDYMLLFFTRKALYSELGKTAAPSAFLRLWYKFLNIIPKDTLFSLRNSIAARNNKKRTTLTSHYLYQYPERCKYGMPLRCLDSYTETEFEGMSLPIMVGYDEYLTVHYADYMTPPPPEKRGSAGEASKIVLLPITLDDIHKRYKEINEHIKEK